MVPDQKAGLSCQPICNALGTTTMSSSPGLAGMTYAKFHRSSRVTRICQYPSAKSSFETWMCYSAGTVAMKSKMRGKTFPSSFTGPYGANRVVVAFTDA